FVPTTAPLITTTTTASSTSTSATTTFTTTTSVVPTTAPLVTTTTVASTTAASTTVTTTTAVTTTSIAVSTTTTSSTTTTVPIGCRLTGGGVVIGEDDGDMFKTTFGGQVGAPCGCVGCFGELDPKLAHVQGNWQESRKHENGKFKADSFNSLVCGCT